MTPANNFFKDYIKKTDSKPPGFDSDNNNGEVAKLFNVSGTDKRTGPGIVLKVMAGDKFKALVNAWYMPGTNTTPFPGAPGILQNLINAFTGGVQPPRSFYNKVFGFPANECMSFGRLKPGTGLYKPFII
ncbi:MAG: hypothetical protein KDB92_12940 [Chitinophagaceae bacterium]|nr:hypothetical protein [Chitinophagaceae bacterium]MCB0741919.1 hypothetical protein [Chitinophagaceae bacterium]